MPRRKKHKGKPKPNIDRLAIEAGVARDLLEAAGNIEGPARLYPQVEQEMSRPTIYIVWTGRRIEYVIRGCTRLKKRHAIGGTLLAIALLLFQTVYTHWDVVMAFLRR